MTVAGGDEKAAVAGGDEKVAAVVGVADAAAGGNEKVVSSGAAGETAQNLYSGEAKKTQDLASKIKPTPVSKTPSKRPDLGTSIQKASSIDELSPLMA